MFGQAVLITPPRGQGAGGKSRTLASTTNSPLLPRQMGGGGQINVALIARLSLARFWSLWCLGARALWPSLR